MFLFWSTMSSLRWWILLLTFVTIVQPASSKNSKPHIIFIVADDLGFNDVSWNNPEVISPNLEALARDGVILNQSYVQPVCSPSRAAFMTGRYPYHIGRQNSYIKFLQPTGVSLKYPFISEKLKEEGYSTHLVGKWHLGFCNWSYTPTYRGFDSFFGFYAGSEHYYKHNHGNLDSLVPISEKPNVKIRQGQVDIPIDNRFQTLMNASSGSNLHVGGLDFRKNKKPAKNFFGEYSTFSFAKAVREILKKADPKKPLFLFMSFQNVHVPLQVPNEYENLYKNIKNENRKIYSGMVTAMDDAVGDLVEYLKKYGFWKNLVLAFTSDNGGFVNSGASNYPLRGGKNTLWEGGTRVPTFVYGTKLKKRHYVSNSFFHGVDWYPTFLHLANGKPDPKVDGINQWESLSTGQKGKRTSFVYNIYDKQPFRGAIRENAYKLILGNPGTPDDWPQLQKYSAPKKTHDVYLFDLKRILRFLYYHDPLEKTNLASSMPHVVKKLKQKFKRLVKTMIPADEPDVDQRGDANNWEDVFSPGWCKAK